jgi:hypothetical protein
MFTLAFWKATAERAVKTFAQSLAAVLAGVYGFSDVNWGNTLQAVGIATLLSVVTSVASSQIGGPGPSVTDAEKLSPPPPAA